jgi:TPR repeat protein
MNDVEIEKLVSQAIDAEDFAEARLLLESIVEQNSEFSLSTLGWMHEAKKTGFFDLGLAASYYERAAKIGSLEAFNSLGRVLYNQGEFEKAREAYRAGAELGNLGSKSWLGVMMLSGKGGPIDVENGMVWITAAAKEGHLAAKGQLLILERQRSNSIFRHIVYHFKRISIALSAAKEHWDDPYSGKLF